VNGCTTLLVGKDATQDGSVLAAFNSDGGTASWLMLQPREQHPAGEQIPIYRDWRTEKHDIATQIPQVRETAQVLGTDYLPAMNEHGVGIVVNACRSRRLLNRDSKSCLSHFQLLRIALERARTAWEAILLMGSLVEQHGLLDIGPFPSGKNIGVFDPKEAWWFEAPGGHEWAAARVPDNAVSFNANRFWLGELNLDDAENVMASSGVVTFAIEQGWYDPKCGRAFDFTETYGDKDPGDVPSSQRVYSTLREWRIASLVTGETNPAPEQGVDWDGPHVVVPRNKLALADVYRIMRDHYEGTLYDTHRPENGGSKAGCPHPPFMIPTPYPRPIDMFNTQMSYVAQAREVAPKVSRGTVWYALHSPSTGCYVPFYPSAPRLHPVYANGSRKDGAFWRQFTLNILVRQSWNELAPRIRATYDRLEKMWIAEIPDVDRQVQSLSAEGEEAASQFLDEVSVNAAETALRACSDLVHASRNSLAEQMMQETLDEPLENLGE